VTWLTLAWVGQAFPLFWLGLGVRSALLPGHLAARRERAMTQGI
jgi:hypothetical protein